MLNLLFCINKNPYGHRAHFLWHDDEKGTVVKLNTYLRLTAPPPLHQLLCQSFIWLVMCLFLLIISTSSAMSAAHWQQPSYIETAFFEIALKNEYNKKTPPLRKWHSPVRIYLDYRTSKDPLYAKLIRMHIAHLTQITGHSITLTEKPSEANVNVILTSQKRWVADVKQSMGVRAAQHASGAVCMATIGLNAQHALAKAVVVIPVDQAQMHRKLVTCVVEEITQIMGLPNDAETVYPSIFNDKTPDDLLTGLDGLLLKLLYQPELKSGMTAQQVRPIVRKIIAQWAKDGTITHANQTMRNGKLYPLLGY